MWLINTKTLELHEFLNLTSLHRKYAILSHRWEENETNFKDFKKKRGMGLAGAQKVTTFCRIALQDGYDWAWADTCCIDKKSSAELSEAINSMYSWYAGAGECYTYLSDVAGSSSASTSRQGIVLPEGFARSQWFTRGWTLQELIAPTEVVFLDSEWQVIARRTYITRQLSQITGIDESVLSKSRSLDGLSIATKLSWAASRVTTRPEDETYCLLGIFEISMPLLYGEGQKAFLRLQKLLIEQSCDMSIFLWGKSSDRSPKTMPLLADRPQKFLANKEYIMMSSLPLFRLQFWTMCKEIATISYSTTNRGLHIKGLVMPAHEMLTPESYKTLFVAFGSHAESKLLLTNILIKRTPRIRYDADYQVLALAIQIRTSELSEKAITVGSSWVVTAIVKIEIGDINRKLSDIVFADIFLEYGNFWR